MKISISSLNQVLKAVVLVFEEIEALEQAQEVISSTSSASTTTTVPSVVAAV